MINVTKKYVDILVNGGQQGSFEQYDTNGDYDISISDNATIENGTLQTFFAYRDRHELGFTENYSWTVGNDGLNGIDTMYFSVSGSYVVNAEATVNGTTYGQGGHSVSLTEGDTIDVTVECDNVSSNRTAVAATRLNLSGDYNVQTGYSVNGVNQSTSN